MNVIFFVQYLDIEDDIRGFIHTWAAKLAERVNRLFIIALKVGKHNLMDRNIEIYSLGKEKGYRHFRRAHYLYNFHKIMTRILSDNTVNVILTHMSPIFTVLAAPYAKRKGIPIVTWYAHRQVTTMLKLAHHLSDLMVTSAETAYHYKPDKLAVIGQGIDTELFSPDGTASVNPPLLLSVGRLSPIKDLLTFVRAVHLLRQWGYDLQAALIGDAPERDHLYTEQIKSEVERLGLNSVVQFAGAVPHGRVVRWYRRCVAHINCSPSDHSLDKAALEAIACGKPSLSSTLGFRETMGQWADWLLFRQGDAGDLAKKLKALLELSAAEREGIGLYLREQVIQMHNLERLTDKLIELFREMK